MLRAASGVTQRANSVWPREPGSDPHGLLAALREARLWYRNRRLPLIFQVFEDPRHAPLNAVLDEEGFTRQSETLVLVRDGGTAAPDAGADPGVEISAEPSAEWLRLWWSVDGRGDDTALAVARGILERCPALYALVRDDDGRPAAVGRLAVPPVPGRRRAGRAGCPAGCTAWRHARTPGGAAMPPGSCRRCCVRVMPGASAATGCWSWPPMPEPGNSTPAPGSAQRAGTSTGRNGRSGT